MSSQSRSEGFATRALRRPDDRFGSGRRSTRIGRRPPDSNLRTSLTTVPATDYGHNQPALLGFRDLGVIRAPTSSRASVALCIAYGEAGIRSPQQVEPDVRGDVVLLDVAVDAVRVPGDAEPAPMIDVGPLPEG
jgi:hypothetical protein